MSRGFRQAAPAPPLPDGLTVERFATAMAAANGVSLLRCDEAEGRQYRRSAHAALLVFAVDAPGLGAQLGGQRLADVMDEARACLRYVVGLLDGPDAVPGDEVWLSRLYRCATTLEAGSDALESIEPETEEVL